MLMGKLSVGEGAHLWEIWIPTVWRAQTFLGQEVHT